MKLISTRKIGMLTLALSLGCGVVSAGSSSFLLSYPFAAVTGINSDHLTENEAAYQRLNDLLNDLQSDFDTVTREFQVLVPIMGGAWGGQFGQQMAAIGQQINVMRGQLSAQYSAGTLTSESTIDNYDNISGLLAGLKAQFEQTINGNVQSILYDLNMMSAAGLGSIIGDLEKDLNKYGVAEQFADRIAALYEKKSAAASKVEETTAGIGGTTDYVERLTMAQEAKVFVYDTKAEIEAECAAILEEAMTLGIASVNIEEAIANGKIYDLNGRRVSHPAKGLYIVNGKKVMMK